MRVPNKQRGLTMISWVFVVAGIALIMTIMVKVLPVYLDNFAVRGALKAIEEDDSMRTSSKEQVVEAVIKRMNVNEIKDVERDNIIVQKDPNQLVVDVEYAAQRQIVGNIYIFIVFSEHVERRF